MIKHSDQKPHDSLLNYSDFYIRLLPFIKCISRGVVSRLTYRIELKDLPPELELQVLSFIMACVACGRHINPFRSRGTNLRGRSTGIYFSATCPTDITKRCCRTTVATAEFELIATAVANYRNDLEARR
jgi:hypothetical protein